MTKDAKQDELSTLKAWFKARGITEVECLVPDLAGEAKGKITPASLYLHAGRARLPDSVFAQSVTGEYPANIDDILDPAERDMMLIPDPSTCRLVPWAPEPTAQIIHDCKYLNGDDVTISPRYVLRKVLQLYKDRGLRPIVAPEMEFYLIERNTDPDYPLRPPAGRSGRSEISRRAYSIDAVNEFDPVFEVLYDYCEKEGLNVDTLDHEEGSAQMEINFRHGDPLVLADEVFIFKRTLREVALAHNMYGTFMAKPMANEPGSSMHIHQSLVDLATEKNAFSDEHGKNTDAFLHYIGGLQTYLPSALVLIAPNVNSYRRLLASPTNVSAPFNVEWGVDNRTAGLRVPQSGWNDRRVENRLAGADANPYLAMAASLVCGYLGLTCKLQPRPPIDENANTTKGAYAHHLPQDLKRALDAFDECTELKELLGERFVRNYVAVKHTEDLAHFTVISSWERQYLLLRV